MSPAGPGLLCTILAPVLTQKPGGPPARFIRIAVATPVPRGAFQEQIMVTDAIYLPASVEVAGQLLADAGVQFPLGAVASYVWTSDGSGNGSWQPAAGGGMANPMTTLGDLIYENATPAAARLAGDTTNTRKFLRGQASGGVAQAPAWDTLQAGDVPTLNQNTTGTAGGLSATLAIASGGTGQATAAAAYNALSPMTTLGDLEYESGAATASRLAGNTTSQKQFLSQAGTGSVSAAPAWAVVPGQVLAVSQYAPASLATLSVASTTFAAFSSANVNTGSFVAPASGNVLVTASFIGNIQTATTGQAVALAAHGTVTPIVGNEVQWAESSINVSRPYYVEFYVTGLTPGTSYNFDLLGGSGSASDAFQILALQLTSTTVTAANRGGPVVMKVMAMP